MIDLTRRYSCVVAVTVCLISFAGTLFAADPAYHVVAHYPIHSTGPITALVLDSKGRALYIGYASNVDVLNADTGAQIAGIPVGAPIQGIALALDLQRAFIAAGNGTVRIVDTSTQKVIHTARCPGKGPFSVAYDSATHHTFVADATDGTLTVIDGSTGKLVGTVHLSGEPGQMISNGYGHIFVAAPKQNTVHVIDTALLKDLGAFPARYGEGCGGLALDPVGRRLFVACENGVLNIIDTDIGFTFQQLTIGSGNSQEAFTFLPQGKGGWKGAIFVASPDGALSVLRMNAYVSYSQGTTIHVRTGIRGIVFDPQTHQAYLAAPADSANPLSSNAASRWEILAVAE